MVFHHRTVGEKIKILKHKAHVLTQAANGRFLLVDAAPGIDRHVAYANRAAFRLLQEINTAQQRRFPRTAGTDNRHHFPLLNLKVDTMKHRLAMEFFHQVLTSIALILDLAPGGSADFQNSFAAWKAPLPLPSR